MAEQRRATERFDSTVVGGPLTGLRILTEKMSDGTYKIYTAGVSEHISDYDLYAEAKQLRYREVAPQQREP